MKLKFVAYWNTDYNIFQFINDIWNIDGRYDKNLTYENDYDYLVIMNKINYDLYNPIKSKTYSMCGEPYWSTSFDKNLLDYSIKLITYQPDKYEPGRTIHLPYIGQHRLYETPYHGEPITVDGTTKMLLSSEFIKTKKLSIIINYHHDAYTHPSTEPLYNKRDYLVRKLLESDLDFDFYGKSWNVNDRRYKGYIENKIDGLKDYEYSICLENSGISGEITEKFIDAIFCNTIPIYNGNKDVELFYPNSCEYLDYDGNEIDRIRHIINSNKTYKDYDLEKTKSLYLFEYNPIKIILQDIYKL